MKRSRLEICFDTLNAIVGGANTPTKLCYRVNLSWVALQEIINFLLSSDYVVARGSESRRTYELTKQGYEVVRKLQSLNKDFEPIIASARNRPEIFA